MRKVLLLVAALVAGAPFAGSAVARDRGDTDRSAQTSNQIAAQEDVRIARIKANLRLTPDQEKNWPGIETVLRDMGKTRAERQVALQADRSQQKEPSDLIEFLNTRSKRLGDRSADMKKLADAAQPLYASLDEQQKKRFANELMDLSRGRNPD